MLLLCLLPLALALGLLGSTPAVGVEPGDDNAAVAAPAEVTPTDRGRAVDYWREGGPGVRAGAEAALTGSDADLQAFLAVADDLTYQDHRVSAVQLASVGGTELLAAARQALAEPHPRDLEIFIRWGWEAPKEQDDRVLAAQVIEAGGPNVREAGRVALNGSAENIAKFLNEGQYFQRQQDERVQLVQVISVGGVNVRAAGRLALNGGAEDIREFLEVGQFVARAKDQEHATVAQLAGQAKEAGRQAAKETEAAKTQSAKAVGASKLAREAALKAASEAAAAKDDTNKAARAAGRAAKAASQAASAAQTAISAAQAANNSARIAANAASQAAAAAAGAAQAASKAQSAAADAAVDASNADAARKTAENARTAAKGADLAADAASQAVTAATAAGDAAHSAASAGVNATLAANAAVEASGYANGSSAAAAEARAAAAATKRHAAEANRAAAAAESLARKAGTAAAEARDAARSAATHARNAAKAADEAAEHAGEAATAAAKSTAYANAATTSANAATQAVTKANSVYTLAREVEAEELLGRTNAGIERAKDQKAAETALTLARTERTQAAKDRETERNRLVALAAQPNADLGAIAAQGRKLAVLVMKSGNAWQRATAEAALGGDDAFVIDYLRNGWRTAKEQGDRTYVARLAEEIETAEVREAAETALDGDAASVTAFLETGQYQVAAQSMRVAIAQIVDRAGPTLTEAGQAALATNDPKKYSGFLSHTQHTARTQDERVTAAQLLSSGTPELKSAARIALEGSTQTLHAFIATGQYKAKRKDYLNAAHVATIQKMIGDAAKIAATAQQNAATAQKVAATARKAAAEANEWADKADASANEAKGYADQALQYSKDADASAASAANSANTARNAANSSNAAAENAAVSAADATLSSEMAQISASTAWYAADQAKQSAVAAGEDAAGALKAATEAMTIAVTKLKEEEEVRRKAAVAKKIEAMNSPGAQARKQYRCGLSISTEIPCGGTDAEEVRWCMQNEIACKLILDGSAVMTAAKPYWDDAKELTGLGEFEACLMDGNLESCAVLAGEALVGSKLKALDTAYDGLKWLRRGCTQCFPAGTKVLMGDRSRRNIEDVYPGDRVIATDPSSGLTAVREVTRQIVTRDDKHFNKLTIGTSNGPENLIATHEHPFWSVSDQRWIEASLLKPGMRLLSDDGSTVGVEANNSYSSRQTTYNLTVAGIHTYYVLAGNTSVLVHNSNCVDAMLDDASELYVQRKHMPGGDLVRSDKSVFQSGVDLDELIDMANKCDCRGPNERGFFERDVDAKKVIGNLSVDQGGMPTTRFRLVQDKYGGVITMHPIP